MYGPTPGFDPLATPVMQSSKISEMSMTRQSFLPPPYSPVPGMYSQEVNFPRQSMQMASSQSNASDAVRRRSFSSEDPSVTTNATEHFPSDTELLNEIRHILSTSDLMTITKKKVRQQLTDFFGVDLSTKKEYINQCIDSILKGEL